MQDKKYFLIFVPWGIYLFFLVCLSVSIPYFFISLDGIVRGYLGFRWSIRPFLRTSDATWLPLHMWIHGLIIKLTGNVYESFIILNVVAGLVCLYFVYKIGKFVFDQTTGFLASLFLGLTPTFAFLSLSHQSEPLFWGAFTGFAFFWMRWAKEGGKRDLIFAIFCLTLSVEERYEAWPFLVIFTFYLLLCCVMNFPSNWRTALQFFFPPLRRWPEALLLSLPWGFVIMWVIRNLSLHGVLLYNRIRILDFWGGKLPPLSSRLILLPHLLWGISPFLTLIGMIGFLLAFRKRGQAWLLLALLCVTTTLYLYLFAQGLITAAYVQREPFLIIIFLSIFSGHFISIALKKISTAFPSRNFSYFKLIFLGIVLIFPIWWAYQAKYPAMQDPDLEAAFAIRNNNAGKFNILVLVDPAPNFFNSHWLKQAYTVILNDQYPIHVIPYDKWSDFRLSHNSRMPALVISSSQFFKTIKQLKELVWADEELQAYLIYP